jgi:hypothetical protein
MKDLKPMAKTAKADMLCELECSQLAEVTGGSTLPYGSNFSEWPPPRSFTPFNPTNPDPPPAPGVHVVDP